MDRKRQILLAVTAAATVTFTGCGGGQEQVVAERPAVPVQVQVVAPSNEIVTRTYTGTLEGRSQAAIYAKIAEAVEDVKVREGEQVKAGQVLVTLDRSGSSSSYEQAQSVYRNAEKNYTKMKYLYEQGAVSESQYDAARTDYEVAQARFESARRLVEIQSPIDGVVTEVSVRRGDYLTQGASVATVAATDSLRIRLDVKPEDVHLIAPGDTVEVVSEAVPGSAYGRIHSVAQSADPVTRTFQVEARMDNAGLSYRPGMFVRVKIVLRRLTDVLAIPRDAVSSIANGMAVFVTNDSTAHQRTVKLGPDLEGRVVIDSGLEAGDSLVVLGQSYLEDGTPVDVTEVTAETK